MSAHLRDYQIECRDSCLESLNSYRSTLAVMATGTGKTQCGLAIAAGRTGGTVLWLAHREELVRQPFERWRDLYGEYGDIIQKQLTRSASRFKSRMTFASVQTLYRDKRLRSEFPDPKEVDTIIVDESHHHSGDTVTYSNIIDYFMEGNPNCRKLGLTATPDRADEKSLSVSFESVGFEYPLYEPNGGRSAISDGWLVPVEQETVFIEGLQLDAVGVQGGDFIDSQLEHEMLKERPLHRVTEATWDIANGGSTIVFTAGVEQAIRTSEIFCRKKEGSSFGIVSRIPEDGKEYPWCILSGDKDRRKWMFDRFRKGEFQILSNCSVACLDEQTEILTSEGWVGHTSISYQHKIANWENGKIWFDNPIAIEIRDRREDERMVFLETVNRSIRITDDHRVVFRKHGRTEFDVKRACELIAEKCELPISGHATPFEVHPEQEGRKITSRDISANSYNVRKTLGVGIEESKRIAEERLNDRNSMRFKSPSELSDRECEFIGFWLGDGTKSNLQRGGIEYLMWQDEGHDKIVSWIDSLVSSLGLDVCRRIKKPRREGGSKVVQWSMSRGTGFGQQKRIGLYSLEPYLVKDGSQLLWGLSRQQFCALMRGFWMADGNHGNASSPICDAWSVCNTNRKLFDLLQSIACCRGFRANISDGVTNTDEGHKPLWRLTVSSRETHSMTKYCLAFEDTWKPEKVWCVKSHSGLIVTRRRGTVTVTGNTEGFDAPITRYISMGRPTKSRALFSQQAGRATRVLPNVVEGRNEQGEWWRLGTAEERRAAIAASSKPNCVIIDFVGNTRHSLVSAIDVLGGKMPDEVVERANKNATEGKGPKNAVDALKQAEEELEAERQKREMVRLAADAEKRKLIEAKVAYTRQKVDVFHVLHVHAVREPEWHRNRKPTQKMIDALGNFGVKPEEMSKMSFTMACATLDRIKQRREQKLCTYKQAKLLASKGIDGDNISFDKAKVLIDKLAANKWIPLPPSEVIQIVGHPK